MYVQNGGWHVRTLLAMAGIEVVELGGASLAEALQHTGAFLKALDGSPKTLVLNVTAERLGDVGRVKLPRAAKDVPRLGILIHGGVQTPKGFLAALHKFVRPTERLFVHLETTHDPLQFDPSDTETLYRWMCAETSTVSHAYLRGSRVFSAQSLLCGRLVALAPALQSLTYLDTQWCNQRFDQSPALGLAVYSGNVSATDGRWRRVQVCTWAASSETVRTSYECGQRGEHGTDLGVPPSASPVVLAAACLQLA